MAGRAFHCSARPGSDREAVDCRGQSRGHCEGTGSPEVSTNAVSTNAVSTTEVSAPALLQQHGEPLATAVLLSVPAVQRGGGTRLCQCGSVHAALSTRRCLKRGMGDRHVPYLGSSSSSSNSRGLMPSCTAIVASNSRAWSGSRPL